MPERDHKIYRSSVHMFPFYKQHPVFDQGLRLLKMLVFEVLIIYKNCLKFAMYVCPHNYRYAYIPMIIEERLPDICRYATPPSRVGTYLFATCGTM